MAKTDNTPSNDLTAEQKAAAKATLMADAAKQYKKTTKSVEVMQDFSNEIIALRKTGHPWTVISYKLKDTIKVSISATTLRNFFARRDRGPAKKTLPDTVSAELNIFEGTTPDPQAD